MNDIDSQIAEAEADLRVLLELAEQERTDAWPREIEDLQEHITWLHWQRMSRDTPA